MRSAGAGVRATSFSTVSPGTTIHWCASHTRHQHGHKATRPREAAIHRTKRGKQQDEASVVLRLYLMRPVPIPSPLHFIRELQKHNCILNGALKHFVGSGAASCALCSCAI
jgi:hypothetical protein